MKNIRPPSTAHKTTTHSILGSVADSIKGTQPIDQSKHSQNGWSSSQRLMEYRYW